MLRLGAESIDDDWCCINLIQHIISAGKEPCAQKLEYMQAVILGVGLQQAEIEIVIQ